MEVSLAVVADYANVSQEGKLNILGVFDSINATKVPVVHLSWFLVLRLTADTAERGERHQLTIQLCDPDMTQVFSDRSELQVPEAAPPGDVTMGIVTQLPATRFAKTGPYEFRVSIDDEVAKRIKFEVRQIVNPAP